MALSIADGQILSGSSTAFRCCSWNSRTSTKTPAAAYERNLADYKDTIPHLFHHNAVIVLGNGVDARLGSLSSRYEHFHEWKRLDEDEPGVVDMETLLKGICHKRIFLDLCSRTSSSLMIAPANWSRSSPATINSSASTARFKPCENGTHDSANSACSGIPKAPASPTRWYSLRAKCTARSVDNITFLICTDRDDLDTQIYKTFAGCGVVDNDRDPCRAGSGEHLQDLAATAQAHVFSLIQKFNKDVDPSTPYSIETTSSSFLTRRTARSTDDWRSICATPCPTPVLSASPGRRCLPG